MSHRKEREEKICLNCNTSLSGRYCHNCGQENIDPKENAWHLITHFIYDIVHFDGKFFSSLKYLLFKPGYLSSEYLKGRRASYLHPIKMYIFTSFIFFFITFFNSHDGHKPMPDVANMKYNLAHQKDSLIKMLNRTNDSILYKEVREDIEDLNEQIVLLHRKGEISNYDGFDTTGIARTESQWEHNRTTLFGSEKYTNVKAYDSIQQTLSANERDNWAKRFVIKRTIAINEKYRHNGDEFKDLFKEKFLHSIPKMMFISLPLVALLLQLLYIRHKKITYVSHGIFTVHLYIAIFILLLLVYLLGWLRDISHWALFNWLANISIASIFFYQYKAMKNFYQQERGTTVLKFILLHFMVFFLFLILLICLLTNSLLSV